MKIFLSYSLVFTIVSIIAINYTLYRSVKLLRSSEKSIEKVSEINNEEFNKSLDKLTKWGELSSFSHEALFLFHGVMLGTPLLCASWINIQEKTRMLLYISGNVKNIDFVTKYSDFCNLTTASTVDAMMLPFPPSDYVQSFTKIGIYAQYYKHLEARELLEKKRNIVPILPSNLLSELSKSSKRQANYIMSLPFWYLRGVYWYFIRRNSKVNKRIVV